MHTIRAIALFLLGFALLGGRGLAQEAKAPASTLDNLQAAYNGESNANAKYLAFSEAAAKEGLTQLATLFRAAARAEEIHAANHAKVIEAAGAQPKKDVQKPDVKSAMENLKVALAGETYERDTMYPQFIKLARTEGKRDALRSFNYAATAEAEHAKLYQASIDQPDGWKAPNPVYFVCPVCGYTSTSLPDRRCPSCFTNRDKFEKIS